MRFVFTVLAVSILSPAAPSQIYRFDMGPDGAPSDVESTWLPVKPDTLYNSVQTPHYGWDGASAAPEGTKSWPELHANIAHTSKDAVLKDSVVTTTKNECVFRVDLGPGSYRFVAYLGDVGAPNEVCSLGTSNTPLEGLEIAVDTGNPASTTVVASGLVSRTMMSKAAGDEFEKFSASGECMPTSSGGYLKHRFSFTVPAGGTSVGIHFRAGTSVGSHNSIQGLEVYAALPFPIGYDHGLDMLVDRLGSTDVEVTEFLAAMGIHDYVAAHDAAVLIGDTLTKATALLWLVGWLDGSEEARLDPATNADVYDPRDLDLDVAIGLLESLAPSDVRVAELLDNARDFKLARFHDRARGYDDSLIPGSLQTMGKITGIVRNLGAAELLYRQIQGDLFDADDPTIETSPLYPRSEYLRAVQYYGRATKLGPNGAGMPKNPTNYWHEIIARIANRGDLFPKAATARMFHWIAEAYPNLDDDPIVSHWQGNLPHTYHPSEVWWTEFLAPEDTSSAPDWARHMRAYLHSSNEATRWWTTRRLLDGELGTGDGDDIELVANLWVVPRAYSPDTTYEAESETQADLRHANDIVLFGPNVDPIQGYFKGAGDVEHAGEYTNNPLFAMLPARYGDPNYLEFPMRILRNTFTTDDAPWWKDIDTTSSEQWHFRSYVFGASAVQETSSGNPYTQDMPINLRSIIPVLFLLDYGQDTLVIDQVVKLAKSWRTAALTPYGSAPKEKPIGIPPAGLRTDAANYGVYGVFDAGEQKWWSNGYDSAPDRLGYVYTLLYSAYRYSPEPLSTRVEYLRPIYEAGTFIKSTAGDPTTTPGTSAWSAGVYQKVVATSFFEARDALYTHFVTTQAGQDSYDHWMRNAGTGFVKFVLLENKAVVSTIMQTGNDWLSYFWPLGTSTVAYNDRAYLQVQGTLGELYSFMTGGLGTNHTRPIVTWENRDSTPVSPVDIAPLVNLKPDHDGTQLILLVYNFGAAADDVTFRIWDRMKFGSYRVRWGLADAQDLPTLPASVATFTYDRPGSLCTVQNVPKDQVTSIHLTLLNEDPAPAVDRPDPAVGLRDAAWNADKSGIFVKVHNVGRQATNGSVLVECRQNGVPLGSNSVSSIPAPSALYPSRSPDVPVATPGVDPAKAVELFLTYNDTMGEISTVNNVAVGVVPAERLIQYGNACSGCSGPIPQIGANSDPYVGNGTFAIELTNGPTGSSVEAWLFSSLSSGSAPYKCGQFLVGPLTIDPVVFDISLTGSVSVPLPLLNPALAGAHAFFQWIVIDSSSAPTCYSLSSGLEMVVDDAF